MSSDTRQAWWGMWIGAGVSMTALIGGMILVALGHDVAGAGIAGSTIVGLAGVFVYGTRSSRAERVEKARIVELMKNRGKLALDVPTSSEASTHSEPHRNR